MRETSANYARLDSSVSPRAPVVSVLMTLFNRERYIGAAIESVLAQTFENFELLVVDDGSIDDSFAIAQAYAARDSRVRVVRNEKNLGDYANRNHAALLATGTLLKYADSDDLMYPHCLATMVRPLLAEPRAGFALSLSHDFAGGPCPMLLTPRMCYQREFLSFSDLFWCGPGCALFRRDVFHSLGGFPLCGAASDNLFWLHACARVNVLALPADLFWYRRHAGQEIQSDRAAKDYAHVLGEQWRALQAAECPLTAQEREQARRTVAVRLVRAIVRDVREDRWELARSRAMHAGLSAADWARYLRRPRRSVQAGTPLSGDGEFLIPDWSQFGVGSSSAASISS